MRVQALVHVPEEGLGSMEGYFLGRGHVLRLTRLFRGDLLPTASDFDWLVIMGGPMSVRDEAAHPWLVAEKALVREAANGGKLVLGICLGAQIIAEALGGSVAPGVKEIGWFSITPAPGAAATPFAPAFAGPQEVFHWHGETFTIPPGAARLASSDRCENQAFCVGGRILALQYHGEVLPEALFGMATAFASDLDGSPGVQSAEEMLGKPARFAGANRHLEALLDLLAAGA